jgi:hypothetical protein
MQRLVEQPVGDGDVFEGATRLARVHYHLSVYQHFSGVDDESVPPNLEVEGRIAPHDPVDLAEHHRKGSELVLHLVDGRTLSFTVAGATGMIRSTGRGLSRMPD